MHGEDAQLEINTDRTMAQCDKAELTSIYTVSRSRNRLDLRRAVNWRESQNGGGLRCNELAAFDVRSCIVASLPESEVIIEPLPI